MTVLSTAYHDVAVANSKLREERDRLLAAIKRIDAINDNPAVFNSEINKVCDAILRPDLE